MKKNLIIAIGCFLFAACGGPAENVEKTESNEELGESYGPVEVNIEEAVSVEEMLTQYEGQTEEMEFTFEGKLAEVCSKAGCWVNVDNGDGNTFMVRFKDHFTIPTETEINSMAYVHGVAFWDTVSVEMLQHFAEDAGQSEEEIAKITEPKFELGFIADGITLQK